MKTCFLITSAINTKFGVIPKEQRLVETFGTIESIQKRVPSAHITLIDMCGEPLLDEQIKQIESKSVSVKTYNDENVRKIYEIPSQDIVKNLTEMICFSDFVNRETFYDYDRVFKISGRYQLNDNFDLSKFETVDPFMGYISEKMVFSGVHNSQFTPEITGNDSKDNFQYMSRLWSFVPQYHNSIVRTAYFDMIKNMIDRLNAGGYIDIEHLLYKHMPKEHLVHITPIGLTGGIAPNGMIVND